MLHIIRQALNCSCRYSDRREARSGVELPATHQRRRRGGVRGGTADRALRRRGRRRWAVSHGQSDQHRQESREGRFGHNRFRITGCSIWSRTGFCWHSNKSCTLVQESFSAEINFFHGFAGTGFLERISLAILAEKTKKLITKNRLDQRSRHFRDSVY